MIDERISTTPIAIRLATPTDIEQIDHLDSFSASPTRSIHREVEKYFGSVDPSTHEYTLIFLAEIAGNVCGKAELMLPPTEAPQQIGYVKRVIVHPDYRGRGISKSLMRYLIGYAHEERHLTAIDLLVWENNVPAIQLYEELGFSLQHRELYYRLHL
ncbi:GNAT family N-acetyltransferase [Ktedonobacter robiniae]|uniref:N-acetyltransferase domain-containing protein n=1 Tax=Ktedonobacter robiniae TaxID=2778365 RepID=A0ABQ3UPQ1_9CHLR|nr:N-acetyltransferase [Ktedonobacter robiniae]GHO54719.1 hypothetical protein KSB_31940 [Ktedonobacter robiniae]